MPCFDLWVTNGHLCIFFISKMDHYLLFLFTEPKNEINAVDFSLEGNMYATAGKDFSIRLYNTETNEVRV